MYERIIIHLHFNSLRLRERNKYNSECYNILAAIKYNLSELNTKKAYQSLGSGFPMIKVCTGCGLPTGSCELLSPRMYFVLKCQKIIKMPEAKVSNI